MGRPITFIHEDVVDASMQVFWKRGYYNTSVEDLLKASGLARSSFYNSFGGKQELFDLSIRHYVEYKLTQFGQAFAGRTFKAGMEQLFADVLQEKPNARGCLLFETAAELSDSSAAHREAVDWGLQTLGDYLTKQVVQAQAAGELAADVEAGHLVVLILLSYVGLQSFKKAGISPAHLQGAAKLAASRIFMTDASEALSIA